MTDNENGLEDSSAKQLKPSTSANDHLNRSIDENRLWKRTKAKNENVALLFPNSSCSPGESVFSIDHILESIFAELDRKTLLNCRLVSRRSLHFSSKCLRKTVTLTFRKHSRIRNNREERTLFCYGHPNRTTKSLITLMNSSNDFPCTSYSFQNGIDCNFMRKTDPMAQRFFSVQGPAITKLQFHGDLLLSDLKRLFLTQAPNLEELIFLNVEFRFTDADYRLKKSETEEKRRWRRESLFDPTTLREKPVFKNFKKYIELLGPGVPEDFLQQLLECSPNLVEVDIGLLGLHNLVQPVNRLHLLKKLELSISEENLELLKAVANNYQDNWAVQKIILHRFDFGMNPAMAAQGAEAVSKILKSSSATCRKLRWHGAFNNFQIPPMHRVKNVHFCGDLKLPVNIFPPGLSLGDSFPDLRSIKISFECAFSYCKEYLSIKKMFGEDDPVPVPLSNVRKVFLQFPHAQELPESFKEKFPNAVIKSIEEDARRIDEEDAVVADDETRDESDDEKSYDDWY